MALTSPATTHHREYSSRHRSDRSINCAIDCPPRPAQERRSSELQSWCIARRGSGDQHSASCFQRQLDDCRDGRDLFGYSCKALQRDPDANACARDRFRCTKVGMVTAVVQLSSSQCNRMITKATAACIPPPAAAAHQSRMVTAIVVWHPNPRTIELYTTRPAWRVRLHRVRSDRANHTGLLVSHTQPRVAAVRNRTDSAACCPQLDTSLARLFEYGIADRHHKLAPE